MLLTSCEKKEMDFPLAPENPNKQELLDLVNKARTSGCYLDNLVWNNKLEQAAQNHSDDMNENDFFSHTGSNGSSFMDRIFATGYDCNSCGENIAKGYATEKAVINAWLKSEGHCKNIMNANFTEMGVATSGSYWTQVLGGKIKF